MNDLTKEQKKKLYNKIERTILSYASLGFFDYDNDPAKWIEYANNHFFRGGITDGEPYNSKVNKNLSTAAMLQVLEEIRKKLRILLVEEAG